MIEYTVIIVFGILTITTGPMKEVISDVMDSIRGNYQGYSFNLSLSDLPDASSSSKVRTLYKEQGLSNDEIDYLVDSPASGGTLINKYNQPHKFLPDLIQDGVDFIYGIGTDIVDYVK